MSVKLPDNFQMREHSWPCQFHIIAGMATISTKETLSLGVMA